MAAGGREPGERGRRKARGGASSRPPRPSPPALRRGPRTIPQALPQAKAVPRAQAIPQAIPSAPTPGPRSTNRTQQASSRRPELRWIRDCPHSCSRKDFQGRGPRRGARGAPSQGWAGSRSSRPSGEGRGTRPGEERHPGASSGEPGESPCQAKRGGERARGTPRSSGGARARTGPRRRRRRLTSRLASCHRTSCYRITGRTMTGRTMTSRLTSRPASRCLPGPAVNPDRSVPPPKTREGPAPSGARGRRAPRAQASLSQAPCRRHPVAGIPSQASCRHVAGIMSSCRRHHVAYPSARDFLG